MQVELQPKQSFQSDDKQAKSFRDAVDSPVFKEGITKALAQFVLFHKPTAEELEGVRRFLAVMLNMAEKEEPFVRPTITESIAAFRQPPLKK